MLLLVMSDRQLSDIQRDLSQYPKKELIRKTLERLGVNFDDIDVYPTDIVNGTCCFRAWIDLGGMKKVHPMPIAMAKTMPLLGFLFQDGTFRDDAEMLCHAGIGRGFGSVETPTHVLIWKQGRKPTRLPDGWNRLRQRPMITIR